MTSRPTTSANLTRRSALAALVAICGYGGYRWWNRREADRHWQEQYEAQQALDRSLEKVVSIQLGETTLRKWFDEFTRQSGVTVVILPEEDGQARPREIPNLEISEDTHVCVDLPRLTAAESLDALGTLYGADWRLRGDGVVLFNDRGENEQLTADVYAMPPAEELSADELIDNFMKLHVDPNEWNLWWGGKSSIQLTAGR